jgi:peptide/nickel transport system substrate-binding protein
MATMFLELRAGNIDSMNLEPTQYLRQTDSPKFRESYRKYKYLAFAYTYLGYNLLNAKFRDKRVRQAITHAIDRKEIIDGILLGLGEIATGPYKPGTWQHNPDVKPYPYDPEKARKLLQEAGWTDVDKDGVLEKNGEKFEFTAITNQGNTQRIKVAEIIQRRLAGVGISMKIRVVEWATLINEFSTVFARAFHDIMLNNAPIQQTLDDVAAEMDRTVESKK